MAELENGKSNAGIDYSSSKIPAAHHLGHGKLRGTVLLGSGRFGFLSIIVGAADFFRTVWALGAVANAEGYRASAASIYHRIVVLCRYVGASFESVAVLRLEQHPVSNTR